LASLTISGPGGTLTFSIVAGVVANSPPPFEQEIKQERAIVTHLIPGREGDRKQDMGKYDSSLRVSGKCKKADADTMFSWQGTAQTTGYTITELDDNGTAVFTSPPMWMKAFSMLPPKGQRLWFDYTLLFEELNNT
jgi:hypothetical protein